MRHSFLLVLAYVPFIACGEASFSITGGRSNNHDSIQIGEVETAKMSADSVQNNETTTIDTTASKNPSDAKQESNSGKTEEKPPEGTQRELPPLVGSYFMQISTDLETTITLSGYWRTTLYIQRNKSGLTGYMQANAQTIKSPVDIKVENVDGDWIVWITRLWPSPATNLCVPDAPVTGRCKGSNGRAKEVYRAKLKKQLNGKYRMDGVWHPGLDETFICQFDGTPCASLPSINQASSFSQLLGFSCFEK